MKSKFLKLSLLAFIFVLVAGWDVSWAATGAPAAGGRVAAEDVKLLADFSGQVLKSQGESLPWQQLELRGAAYVSPGQGLVLQKWGVNEIPDPSFESDGWELLTGAGIEPGVALRGNKALVVGGDGGTRVLARLKQPITFIDDGRAADQSLVGRTRTLSFSYLFRDYQQGSLKVALLALDFSGGVIGSAEKELNPGSPGWREDGLIYNFPEGTAYYQVEIRSAGMAGTAFLDAIKSEHKDYFTPYFDGDSQGSIWVNAATPDNLNAMLAPTGKAALLRTALLAGTLLAAMATAVAAVIYGRRSGWRSWPVLTFLALLTAAIAAVSLAAPRLPGAWPRWLSASGSHLSAGKTYFYRITAVDAEGRESPPSIELAARTAFIDRSIGVSWMSDPGASRYRLYRGTETYHQDEFVEVDKSQTAYLDRGEAFQPGSPPRELPASGGPAHKSRSLRAAPDARIDPGAIGFDSTADFWLTGELEFGFDSSKPFRPASLFEIGNAEKSTSLAVSFRYVPDWGDEAAEILLIKRGEGQSNADFVPEAIPPVSAGSRVRYVVAQVGQAREQLPAGAHLWYRIDDGAVSHLYLPNTETLGGDPYLVISKRNFFDYFANNSTAQAFALVQTTFDESLVGPLLGSAPLPEAVDNLTR